MPYKDKQKQKDAVKRWKEEHKAQLKKVQHKYYLKHKNKFKKPVKHSKKSRQTTHLTPEEYLTKKQIWKYKEKRRDVK